MSPRYWARRRFSLSPTWPIIMKHLLNGHGTRDAGGRETEFTMRTIHSRLSVNGSPSGTFMIQRDGTLTASGIHGASGATNEFLRLLQSGVPLIFKLVWTLRKSLYRLQEACRFLVFRYFLWLFTWFAPVALCVSENPAVAVLCFMFLNHFSWYQGAGTPAPLIQPNPRHGTMVGFPTCINFEYVQLRPDQTINPTPHGWPVWMEKQTSHEIGLVSRRY